MAKKFRIWDRKEKKMHYDSMIAHFHRLLLSAEGDLYMSVGTMDQHKITKCEAKDFNQVPQYEIMFFMGMHDKNKQPIYESDIIEWVDAKEEKQRIIVSINEKGLYSNISHFLLMQASLEVIGNIYEQTSILNSETYATDLCDVNRRQI